MKTHPDDIEVLLRLGKVCADLQKYEDAIVFYKRVLEIDPENAEAMGHYQKLEHVLNAEEPQTYSGLAV